MRESAKLRWEKKKKTCVGEREILRWEKNGDRHGWERGN